MKYLFLAIVFSVLVIPNMTMQQPGDVFAGPCNPAVQTCL